MRVAGGTPQETEMPGVMRPNFVDADQRCFSWGVTEHHRVQQVIWQGGGLENLSHLWPE